MKPRDDLRSMVPSDHLASIVQSTNLLNMAQSDILVLPCINEDGKKNGSIMLLDDGKDDSDDSKEPREGESVKNVERRNERERNRVHTVNQAFAILKEHIPTLKVFTKRVSKLKILRAAILYIDTLCHVLNEAEPIFRLPEMTQQTLPPLSKTSFTIPRNNLISTEPFNMFTTLPSSINNALSALPYFDYEQLQHHRSANNYHSQNDLLYNNIRTPYALESLYSHPSFINSTLPNIGI
uniref:BHLH domain-containing protein n=1 Tax=Rhabditophanes sp. KR3021 TaxID=114890 RepID=A0AC35UB66_9BILA